MEVRSEGGLQVRSDKVPAIPQTRLQVWFIRVCTSILLWTCLVQLVAVGELWHPRFLAEISNRIANLSLLPPNAPPPPPLPPASEFISACFVFHVQCHVWCNFYALRLLLEVGVGVSVTMLIRDQCWCC